MGMDWRIQTNGGFFELIEIAEEQNFVSLDPQKTAPRGSEAARVRVNVVGFENGGRCSPHFEVEISTSR